MSKLDCAEKHLLRLIRKEGDSEGWAEVSDLLMPVVEKLPQSLIDIRKSADCSGFVKLTSDGKLILDWI